MLAGFLLVAIIHNGIAAPWSAAPDIAPPADMGVAHHSHMDSNSGGMPMGDAGSDCCDQSPCDCSCTATPALLLPATTAARDWAHNAVVRAPNAVGFRPAITGAPFRPPA